MRTILAAAVTCTALVGCGIDDVKNYFDPNGQTIYGKESGLPVNCRALIADATDAWKAGRTSPEMALQSIYDHCGRNGTTWGIGK